MDLYTRPAHAADYDWLLDLHHTVYRELIIEEFGYWDDDEELGLFLEAWETKPIEIIMKQDEAVGMFIVLPQEDYLWLDEIQINPQYQNQGIGSTIIAQLIVRARKLNMPLRLRVLHANSGAHRLYRKLGFRQISRVEHHAVLEIQ
ncbi:MAG: GNAT family N-acetyltransferase [Nitrosomonas sp.]|nr:GNAT family N-acetyltransferase [Nitrosomonas sp.]MCW5617999.1 GNAT family N-acetyltransferase [Nitrosomonas sp.]